MSSPGSIEMVEVHTPPALDPEADLATETRFYPEKVSLKPFTFGAIFMGVLPFVCLGPEGSCLFQVDNLNQSNIIQGRVITKNVHYQRFGAISWRRFYQRHAAPDVLFVGETWASELDDKWVQRLVRDTSPPRMIILSHKPGSILTRMYRLKALD